MHIYRGGCGCGNLTVRFESGLGPEALAPRACDCDFCVGHGAAWLSDPKGALAITVRERAKMTLLRQGSNSAEFWSCRTCGAVVCVTADIGDRRYGAVNASRLDDRALFPDAVAVSPKTLGQDEKLARWSQVWVPDVAAEFKG